MSTTYIIYVNNNILGNITNTLSTQLKNSSNIIELKTASIYFTKFIVQLNTRKFKSTNIDKHQTQHGSEQIHKKYNLNSTLLTITHSSISSTIPTPSTTWLSTSFSTTNHTISIQFLQWTNTSFIAQHMNTTITYYLFASSTIIYTIINVNHKYFHVNNLYYLCQQQRFTHINNNVLHITHVNNIFHKICVNDLYNSCQQQTLLCQRANASDLRSRFERHKSN